MVVRISCGSVLVFFFSSRRRHTRCSRDWSSDVCSSDLGLVMVLSASSVQALRTFGSSWVVFQRQAMWMAIGAVALGVALRTDYRRWRRPSVPLLLLSLGLLVVVLVPGLGVSVRGSSRWLGTGQFRMQPSELAKLAILLFAADQLARRGAKGDVERALRPILVVLAV